MLVPELTERRPVRIANCSGFYGDLLDAARQMVEGGPIDVLTGDYLAELTMLILWKARQKDPAAGYARTFLAQLEQVLGTCLDRGIKVVTNAGGLNPAGLADEVGKVAAALGLQPRVAYITGDDLLDQIPGLLAAGVDLAHLDTGQRLADAGVQPVTANAYLGSWGITRALEAGADIVICPRVTDAALTAGPAAWWHHWDRTDFDRLAGAVIAGHVIECGPQACGGNYSFLSEITDRRYPGFPIAEVAADGSSVITKHDGTGGLVSAGTVTAQLLYEIDGPAYLGPDVVAHFDSVALTADGPDRVRISGARGTPPPPTLKVAMNYRGGYRNTMTLVLTGLDIEEKAAWARAELFGLLGGEDRFERTDVRLLRFDQPDAPANEQATAHLRVTVLDPDQRRVGRAFSDAVLALALGGYAASTRPRRPPGPASTGCSGPRWCRPTWWSRRSCCRTAAGRWCRTPSSWSALSRRRHASTPVARQDQVFQVAQGGRKRSPARCRSPSPVRPGRPGARRSGWSPARGPATRAATPTWACGPATTLATPGWPAG